MSASPGAHAIGSVHPRLELRTLQNNKDLWNLYLLGLVRMQAVPQDDKLSWYQIGSIHGMPFTPWDGVESIAYHETGYCVHSSNLFLSWHRPYVALYEQVLQSHVLAAARDWPPGPDRDRYVAAAQTFRAPYWDWAIYPPSGQNNTPPFMTDETIKVVRPNGSAEIPNPLYSYTFHPFDGAILNDSRVHQFAEYRSTMRYPTDLTAKASSQNTGVQKNMRDLRIQLRNALYDIFINYDNLTLVGNMASYHPDKYQSIEAIHGWVHNYVGGKFGNMLNVPWSAYDPSFMLHHVMVDRIFAMWQMLYPNSYVVPEKQDYATYMIQQGSIQDKNSPLAPFHSNTKGDFWTSEGVRNVSSLFYTYPELQLRDIWALKTRINALYGAPTIGHHTKRDTGADEELNTTATTTTTTVLGVETFMPVQPGQVDPVAAQQNLPRFEYVVNFKLDRTALDGSGSLYFFLGNHSENPDDWKQEPNLAGVAGLFVGAKALPGDVGSSIYGSVPLTSVIEERVANHALSCMYPYEVDPFLTKSLTWAMTRADGTAIAPEDVAGLEVSVAAVQYRSALSECEFPERVSPYMTLRAVTNGKPGGLSTDEAV
ncbi:uncharacterized protein K452DRAFT_323522 [Aplosporella prunicola CBS 121167]|uniref:tyrosinase n=1 Tax=Aplosporella prunicola CBS 121167 TaxID=1176127 RepID=A0A6A6BTK6_9PEZI|nr:uncharacterized protein K452DRAFT_323522 [Aplosporella prunicola CBS 121167]KAF2147416.1 hypothetical protein K452DRAFT_323522 [Aplosporella prunicola CBS 121167]